VSCPELAAFLRELVLLDRSRATVRSYRQGVEHFLRWLSVSGVDLEAVSTRVIADYVEAFKAGAKEGAVPVGGNGSLVVDRRTGRPSSASRRRPRTVNHRLSVLSSFFAFLIERDGEQDSEGAWCGRRNPVPQARRDGDRRVLSGGRDAPARGPRAPFRMRVPKEIPRTLSPTLAEELICEARSARDKAILTLLLGSGQRIGDWPDLCGRHGVLGMRTHDLDERRGLVTVRLKGSRDEHRVPVTADFWPLLRRYLREERPADAPTAALWVGFRRGAGRPLRYRAFERALRMLSERVGAHVHAHMFRHTLAQLLVDGSGLAVAQRQLGHRQITTTTMYSRVADEQLIEAVQRTERGRCTRPDPGGRRAGELAFAYDRDTLTELERLASTRRGEHRDA
jgi:integrase/recombinase XerD